MFNLRSMTLMTAAVFASFSGLAVAESSPTVEEVITVIGTRTERSLDEVATSITVISAIDIEEQLYRDIADLVKYEPGVSVGGTGSRFGLSGFIIRGMGGNRVQTLVDGVRSPDEFTFGPFLSSRRDFVDIDSLETVEISKGSGSSLYGSDALGGVVSFTTKGPSRYVSEDEPFYAGIKYGYAGEDNSSNGTLTLAGGNDKISGLVSYTYRDAEETETNGTLAGTGSTREEADPAEIESNNVSLKVDISPWEGHTLRIGYDLYEHENQSWIFSDWGSVVYGTMIKSRDAFDERERDKLSFDYLYSGGFLFIDSAQIKFYQQESESQQMMNEIRQGRTGSATRFRYSEFQQEIDGVYAQLGSIFEVGSSAHTLTYGVDYYTTYSESTRNGGTTDSYGVAVRERSVFPTRDFPITEVDHLAFFIQDEIELMDGKLRLIPGVRYDDFEADAVADSPYVKGNVGLPAPQDYEDSEVTASLGVIYFLEDGISLFGRYSEGFRAPPYDDVNQGFINLAGGYKAAPNPNLTSETSTGFELGVRLDDEYMGLELSIFRNEYEDFIESNAIAPEFLRSGGIDPSDGLLTFQAVNLSEVEIDGVEVSGTVDLAMFSKGFSADQDYLLDDFSVRFAIAYADGEDVSAGQPLDSVEPLTGVIGLAYDSPAGNWGARLNFSMVQGKSPEDMAEGSVRPETAGYGVFDLLAYVNVADQVMVNVGLFNLGDKQYIRWSDSVGIGGDAPMRFSQPGFTAGINLKFEI
jgi:hemoglobin/transferrin/lactoferrin receptor protein